MAFNIWMWILLVLFIVGTIAVILILTVGSVLEERSYDRRSEDENAKFRKNLEMSKGHTDESQESSNGEEQVAQEHSRHVVRDHQQTHQNINQSTQDNKK